MNGMQVVSNQAVINIAIRKIILQHANNTQ
jgi:hypothetical protein